MAKRKGERNSRDWFENDDLAVLQKHLAGPTLVRVVGMQGDTSTGEVIYTVEEYHGRERYPASDRHMKRPTAEQLEALRKE